MPNIDISIGVYMDDMRTAYFYADKESDDRTLYHEATHQLFHESRPVSPKAGQLANFWIIEGIAMYMESLQSATAITNSAASTTSGCSPPATGC